MPRQARSRRVREDVLDVAKQAFAERGFHAVNVTTDIIETLGISPSSFYRQFGDKTDVFHCLLADFDRQQRERIAQRLDEAEGDVGDLAQVLTMAVEVILDAIDADPLQWQVRLQAGAVRDRRIVELVARAESAWRLMVEGYVRNMTGATDATVRAVSRYCLHVANGEFTRYARLPEPLRPAARRAVLETFATYVLAGTREVLSPGDHG